MKKSSLIFGFTYLLLGVIFLSLALLLDTALDSLFVGFTGACIGIGIITICKYRYWISPKNRKRYVEKLENEKILLKIISKREVLIFFNRLITLLFFYLDIQPL